MSAFASLQAGGKVAVTEGDGEEQAEEARAGTQVVQPFLPRQILPRFQCFHERASRSLERSNMGVDQNATVQSNTARV